MSTTTTTSAAEAIDHARNLAEMRARYAKGESIDTLAADYGSSSHQIRSLVREKLRYDDPGAPDQAGEIERVIGEYGRGQVEYQLHDWLAGYKRRAALVAKSDAMRGSRFRSPEQIRQELAAAVPANYATVKAQLLKGK